MFLTRLVSATGLLPSPGETGWVLAPTHLTPPKPSGGMAFVSSRLMGQPSMTDVPKGVKCLTLFQLQTPEARKQRAPVSDESNGEGDLPLVLSL